MLRPDVKTAKMIFAAHVLKDSNSMLVPTNVLSIQITNVKMDNISTLLLPHV